MSSLTTNFALLPKGLVFTADLIKSRQIVSPTANAKETGINRSVKLNKKQQDFLASFEAGRNARDGWNVVTGRFAQHGTSCNTRPTLSDAKTNDASRFKHFPAGHRDL